MSDNSAEELKPSVAPEAETKEELDDNDYHVPSFINKVLYNPELLPPEFREHFVDLFERFEWTHLGRAKTPTEYLLINEITKLALTLEHLDRLERAILANQRRPAAESLFRKTHEGAFMKNAESAILGESISNGRKYFNDPSFREKADKAFAAAGFAPDALEGEAYMRALPSLTVIHRQKAANRKALFAMVRDLESRYASRDFEKKLAVEIPATKRPKPKAS